MCLQERWYAEDRASFEKADGSADCKLDQSEFQAVVKVMLNLGSHDAEKLMKKWDLDQNKTIGPVEWVTFRATFRAEKNYHEQKVR